MFDNLSDRLTRLVKRLRGQGRLSEANIKDSLREVRRALLEADVALPVVQAFIERVRERALGQEVMRSLSPGQMLVKIVHEELITLMGAANEDLRLNVAPPAVILLAGLQGSGKTTSAAKLARFLIERKGKSVLLASCDVYRPAAMDQLRTLAAEVGAEFYSSDGAQRPVTIVEGAIAQARRRFRDVVILDSAGRLHIDEAMMEEIRAVHAAARPIETLFVVDSMTGQDAATTAAAFHQALPLTGVILTKADGDARGGAALSIRHVTGKPIKFLGVGEKTAALESFHPDRLASRILGMGDVLSLVEEIEHKVDRETADKLARKLQKGKGFDLEDFRAQLRQMGNIGGVSNIMDKLPGLQEIPQQVRDRVNDKEMKRLVAIIDSMTPHERRFPAIIKGSRKRRIAGGSGTQIQDVNRLLKQFAQMQKMMKRMSRKGGMSRIMRGMQGRLPPGMPL